MAMKSDEISRYSDLSNEPIDRLLPSIRGYEDKPLASLIEAIQPISGFFNEIEDNVYNCQNPANGLTQQESASIHLYTMRLRDGPSLYVLLNQSLMAENREELILWFSFLKLFLTALYKLPSQSGIVWCGIKNVDLTSKYKVGMKIAWSRAHSCTIRIEVLESDHILGRHGLRTLFSIECINGKSVSNHSYFKNKEREIILMPGSYFEIIGQLNPSPDLHIIQLREIPPPIKLVAPPFSKPTNVNPTFSTVNKSNSYSQSTSNIIPQNISTNVISKETLLKLNTKWKQFGITIVEENGVGTKLNQLFFPYGIFVDDNQTIYIADCCNHRIIEWKSNATNGQIVAGGNRKGEKLHQLDRPTYIFVDEDDSLYVSDYLNYRVMKWIKDAKEGIIVAGGNAEGNSLTQLYGPEEVIVDQFGQIYVADYHNNRVTRWCKGAKEGTIIVGGNGEGAQSNQLAIPRGLSFDRQGNLYVVDSANHRIQRFEIN